jgi:hypothetical protein
MVVVQPAPAGALTKGCKREGLGGAPQRQRRAAAGGIGDMPRCEDRNVIAPVHDRVTATARGSFVHF